jgi:hypothetical protein
MQVRNSFSTKEILGIGKELTRRTWRSPRVGFQSFFRVFTHISPFFAIFGWKILVTKYPAHNLTDSGIMLE